MNTLETLSATVHTPQLALRKLNQAYNWRKCRYNSKGIKIMSRDWDNLIILDACRYDSFKKYNHIKGELNSVISRGSATPEFLRGNFQGETFEDTIYITGNPMLDHETNAHIDFFKIERIWADEGWDNEAGTVLPQTMTKRAIRTHQKYPNKRLLIHYVQPHHPFISEKNVFECDIQKDKNEENNPWMELMMGNMDVERSELIGAYGDTLTRALPAVEELIQHINGKSVVTSDHGNVFGERVRPIPYREWGHPPGVYIPELVQVPWLECPVNGSRRKIIEQDPVRIKDVASQCSVNSRLSALGYVE